jgi:GNAT superfamily N-acetyltransferase
MVIVRSATADDVPAIVGLGHAFFEAANMLEIAPWCPASLAASLHRMIATPLAILLVAEHDGAVVSVAGAMVFPAYWNAAVMIGQETFWFVLPEHRNGVGGAMLDAMEAEARERGAVQFLMVALEAVRPKAVGKLLKRRGYKPLEHSYVRAL